jgi:hypothetical protein
MAAIIRKYSTHPTTTRCFAPSYCEPVTPLQQAHGWFISSPLCLKISISNQESIRLVNIPHKFHNHSTTTYKHQNSYFPIVPQPPIQTQQPNTQSQKETNQKIPVIAPPSGLLCHQQPSNCRPTLSPTTLLQLQQRATHRSALSKQLGSIELTTFFVLIKIKVLLKKRKAPLSTHEQPKHSTKRRKPNKPSKNKIPQTRTLKKHSPLPCLSNAEWTRLHHCNPLNSLSLLPTSFHGSILFVNPRWFSTVQLQQVP